MAYQHWSLPWMSSWALLACDKDNSNQWLHRACTRGPLHVQTSVVHGTWCHCCFSSPLRVTFGTGVDCCDDSVGHNCGCHLVALWAFKGGGNRCRYDLSLSQWVVSSPLVIGSMDNLTLQLLVLYAHGNVSIYLFHTLWKRIESFNEYYRIFVLNVVVTTLSS